MPAPRHLALHATLEVACGLNKSILQQGSCLDPCSFAGEKTDLQLTDAGHGASKQDHEDASSE